MCGLCAGCENAVNQTLKLLQMGKSVTLFKEIVHNKNVNNFLQQNGAKIADTLDEILKNKQMSNQNFVVVIRAHGEPPETYEFFKKNKIEFCDCTCINVKRIHEAVEMHYQNGYKIILIGKYGKKNGVIHPEVFGTLGFCKNNAILIEDEEDLTKIDADKFSKFYLVCQTTFNIKKAEILIEKITEICKRNGNKIVVNKSICFSQKLINEHSLSLAKNCDLMIVVGDKNSSNTTELANALSKVTTTVFLDNTKNWKNIFSSQNIKFFEGQKIGITAGASTLKVEIENFKTELENYLSNLKN